MPLFDLEISGFSSIPSPNKVIFLCLLPFLIFLGPPEFHAQPTGGTIDNGAEWIKQCAAGDPWDKPGPPFRIYGNTYYVGTCSITALLIVSEEGHVIIDGGPRNGGPLIAANVEALGYSLADVKFLLNSHEHFDHVGGLAYLQSASNAKVVTSVRAAPVLETGIISADDPQAGMHAPFAPVEAPRMISDGEKLFLGNIELTALETPGHTPGGLTWTWFACQNGECKTVVYMDSMSPIRGEGYRFMDHPEYVARFKTSLERLKDIPCDIHLTPHPAGSVMFERIAGETGLIDDRECRLYAEDIAIGLDHKLVEEAMSK